MYFVQIVLLTTSFALAIVGTAVWMQQSAPHRKEARADRERIKRDQSHAVQSLGMAKQRSKEQRRRLLKLAALEQGYMQQARSSRDEEEETAPRPEQRAQTAQTNNNPHPTAAKTKDDVVEIENEWSAQPPLVNPPLGDD